jgi:hypothetical protein
MTQVHGSTGSAPLSYADASVPRPEQIAMSGGVTRGDVAVITVRILGIYIMLQGLSELALVGSFMGFGYGARGLNMTFVAVFGVFEAVGIFMVVKASTIGRWLLPQALMGPSADSVTTSPVELQSAAFAVLGVLLVVWAAPDIVMALWRYTEDAIRSRPHDEGSSYLLGLLLKPGVNLVLGLWLFFGSKRLSLYWQKTRAHRSGADSGPL